MEPVSKNGKRLSEREPSLLRVAKYGSDQNRMQYMYNSRGFSKKVRTSNRVGFNSNALPPTSYNKHSEMIRLFIRFLFNNLRRARGSAPKEHNRQARDVSSTTTIIIG